MQTLRPGNAGLPGSVLELWGQARGLWDPPGVMGGKGRHVSTLESRGLKGCHAFGAPQTGAAGSLCLSEGLRGGAVRQVVRDPHFSRRFWPLPEWWWVE